MSNAANTRAYYRRERPRVLARAARRYAREPELRKRIEARTRKYRFVERMLSWWRAQGRAE